MISHSFAPGFYMPEGVDTYDVCAPDCRSHPTTLAEAILALDDEEFSELCERAGAHPDSELAWHDCMRWITDVINACDCSITGRTRVYTDEECFESIDVWNDECDCMALPEDREGDGDDDDGWGSLEPGERNVISLDHYRQWRTIAWVSA